MPLSPLYLRSDESDSLVTALPSGLERRGMINTVHCHSISRPLSADSYILSRHYYNESSISKHCNRKLTREFFEKIILQKLISSTENLSLVSAWCQIIKCDSRQMVDSDQVASHNVISPGYFPIMIFSERLKGKK